MRALSIAERLDVWERTLGWTPTERALGLLAACTGATTDALARLSIGQRDRRLLALREITFGPQLVSVATCPACGDRLEMELDVADLRVPVSPEPPDDDRRERGASDTEPAGIFTLSLDEGDVWFRLPNSLDQVALAGCSDVHDARRVLLQRCLVPGSNGEHGARADRLSAGAWDRIGRHMDQADPQADVRLDMSCLTCAHQWQETFDIGTFLWIELDAWARRTLHDVHAIAMAYGWPERDILDLSESRRQFYLDLINGSA